MINKVKRISVNAQHIMIITVESHYNELKYSQKVIRLNLSLRFIMTTVRQTIQIKKLFDSGIPMKLATYMQTQLCMTHRQQQQHRLQLLTDLLSTLLRTYDQFCKTLREDHCASVASCNRECIRLVSDYIRFSIYERKKGSVGGETGYCVC